MGPHVRFIGARPLASLACFAALSAAAAAGPPDGPLVAADEAGVLRAGDMVFDSWQSYVRSDFFRLHGLRCGTPAPDERPGEGGGVAGGGGGDCTLGSTNPDATYDPAVARYRVPVVVHVIRASNGATGHVSEALVQSQIEVLNEDFLALAGTNGEPGTDVQIEFYLATVDPAGSPTTGITYSNNTSWFNDNGSYWNQLAWDTSRYMNIYTNNAGGALGYVPDLPQGGIVGSNEDRVVILWSAFGRNAPIGPPFNQGRTLTHEVGHYLGLEHTFNGGCGSASACYTSGDLICDTTPQSSPTDGCSGSSCGSPDPIHNYMDYSDDLCMWEFTAEQARRMRCTLEHYRPQLYEVDGAAPGACCLDSACTTTIQADCLAAGGSFLGAGSSCAGEPCSPATGACCATDGSCTITTSSACAGSGGAFQGAGSGCAAACAAPTGACCSGSGTCSVTTSDDCLAGGGSYLGDATSCSPSACGGDGTCGGPGAGDCQSANGTPGCDDADCCETVCADDPFCCDVEWDAICAEQAAASCGGGGGCGSPDAGDCFAANGTPACADAACCETVCQADPFCCDVEWDSVCADGAAELCGDGGGDDGPCGDPGAGDCLAANGTPGCADADCCGVVCGLDPFCCETEWDALCAEQAADECGGDPATCVGDVTGDGLVNVDDLLDLLLDWGASGGPADLDGDGIVGVDDAILLLVNWGPCP